MFLENLELFTDAELESLENKISQVLWDREYENVLPEYIVNLDREMFDNEEFNLQNKEIDNDGN